MGEKESKTEIYKEKIIDMCLWPDGIWRVSSHVSESGHVMSEVYLQDINGNCSYLDCERKLYAGMYRIHS